MFLLFFSLSSSFLYVVVIAVAVAVVPTFVVSPQNIKKLFTTDLLFFLLSTATCSLNFVFLQNTRWLKVFVIHVV